MNKPIILPSGNVVPALHEQLEYLYLRIGINRSSNSQRTPFQYRWSRWPKGRKLRKWDISNSGESKFIQKGFEPKVPDDNAQFRKDWRKRKGFAKDQAKSEDRRGCPKAIKRMCNKEYRSWVKSKIKQGKYSEIGTKCRKDFFDPWLWD